MMNKHNQKPIDMFNTQDVTVYLTYIRTILRLSTGFWLCLFITNLKNKNKGMER